MENKDDQSTGRKIFVGGLSPELTEVEFKNYFEKFGRITDVVVMHDNVTNRARGFGFITFEYVESANSALQNNFHELNGKLVEVKKAIPKTANCNGHISNARGGGLSPVPNSNVAPSYPYSHPYYGSGSSGYTVYPGFALPFQAYGQGVDLYGCNLYGNWYPPSFGHAPYGVGVGGALYSPNLVGMYPPAYYRNSLINPTYMLSDSVAAGNGTADTTRVRVEIKPPSEGRRKLSADAVPFQIKDRA